METGIKHEHKQRSARPYSFASKGCTTERVEFIYSLALVSLSVESGWPHAAQELSGGNLCSLENSISLTNRRSEMKLSNHLPYQEGESGVRPDAHLSICLQKGTWTDQYSCWLALGLHSSAVGNTGAQLWCWQA